MLFYSRGISSLDFLSVQFVFKIKSNSKRQMRRPYTYADKNTPAG